MHFFQPRDGCGLFSCLPSNNKGWHKRFFFISGEGGNSLRGKKIQLGFNSLRVCSPLSVMLLTPYFFFLMRDWAFCIICCLVGCCDVSRETPDLTLEEDLRIKRAMVCKLWDVAELLPSARAIGEASASESL